MESTTLTRVFKNLRARLLGRAAAITGSQAEAEDAVQDAFERLWTSKTPIVDDSHAAGLSHAAVRNASIDILRRHRHAAEIPTSDIEEQNDSDSLYSEVEALIEKHLSPRDRDIMLKRDMYGYEYDELAQLYNISEGNVRMIISRARKTIRDLYRQSKSKNVLNL